MGKKKKALWNLRLNFKEKPQFGHYWQLTPLMTGFANCGFHHREISKFIKNKSKLLDSALKFINSMEIDYSRVSVLVDSDDDKERRYLFLYDDLNRAVEREHPDHIHVYEKKKGSL